MASLFTRIRDALRTADPEPPMFRATQLPVITQPPPEWSSQLYPPGTLAGMPPVYGNYQINKPVWPDLAPRTFVDDGYKKVVVAYRCINVIANAVATAPVRAYEEQADARRVELPLHPLRQLMLRPNPFMGGATFVNLVTKIAASTGFCVVEKERSAAGRVIALWPLRSDWLSPIPRTNAAPDWLYRLPDGQWFVLSAENVIPVIYEDDPLLGYTGVAPLAAALREVGIENAMTDFAKNTFDNGGIPMYLLIPDPGVDWDQASADQLRERWKQRYGAARGAEVGVAASVKDVKRIGLDYNELAYHDLRALTALQICTAFGVPPMLIGVREGLARATYSNYEQARKAFYEDTIMPLWARLDDVLTHTLLAEFEVRPSVSLEFDTSDIVALRDDQVALWDRVEKAFMTGQLKVDEARGLLGFRPLTGILGQAHMLPRGSAYIDEDGGLVATASGRGDTMVDGTPVGQPLVPAKPAAPPAKPTAKKSRALTPPERRRAKALTSNKAAKAKLAKALTPKLARFFTAQGERIAGKVAKRAGRLDALTMGEKLALSRADRVRFLTESRDDPTDEIDWAAEEAALADILDQFYQNAAKLAFSTAGDQIGVDVTLNLTSPVVDTMLGRLGERITGISETTRAAVEQTVRDGLAAGTSLLDLADELKGQFADWSEGRAMTIARTESTTALSSASVAAYRESGVVDKVELSDNPDHTDDYGADDGLSCAERDGLIVSVDDVDLHIESEHINGSLSVLPIINEPADEEPTDGG